MLLKSFAALSVFSLLSLAAQAEEPKPATPAALDFTVESLDGDKVKLESYAGQVLLVVNTASECGLTPQYKELQSLYKAKSEKGLVVLGFPCNQFGGQEPGSAKEIATFCTDNYGVTFPMFAKIDVNGENASPFYKYLTSQETKPAKTGKVKWNFEKFLIDRKGNVVARFAPRTSIDDPALQKALNAAIDE